MPGIKPTTVLDFEWNVANCFECSLLNWNSGTARIGPPSDRHPSIFVRQDGVIQITERDDPCLEESITLPEINMAPKTPGLEDEFSYLEGLSVGAMLVFRNVAKTCGTS